MTTVQIQNIEKVVQDYRKIKNELQEKKREIEKLRDENIISEPGIKTFLNFNLS